MKYHLHNTRIFDRFPPGCPLTSSHPAQEINEAQDKAYWSMNLRTSACHVRLSGHLLFKSKACSRCLRHVLRDPKVRFLRRFI